MKLVTFFTQAGAIRFEKELKTSGIEGKLKPVPRVLSSSCGLCVEAPLESLEDFDIEDVECCYAVTFDGYELLFRNE